MGGGGGDDNSVNDAAVQAAQIMAAALEKGAKYDAIQATKAREQNEKFYDISRQDMLDFYRLSQAQQAPYKAVSYDALDGYLDTIGGMVRPKMGYKKVATALNKQAEVDQAKRGIEGSAAEIAKNFPWMEGPGGLYSGAGFMTELEYRNYLREQESGTSTMVRSPDGRLLPRYEWKEDPLTGELNMVNNETGKSYAQHGIAYNPVGGGQLMAAIIGGALPDTPENWDAVDLRLGQTRKVPDRGPMIDPMAPLSEQHEAEIKALKDKGVWGEGWTPNTMSAENYMKEFMAGTPAALATGYDDQGRPLSYGEVNQLNKLYGEAAPQYAAYLQAMQGYNTDYGNISNAFNASNYTDPEII